MASKALDRRIILEAKSHPAKTYLEPLKDIEKLNYNSGLITQTPVDAPPVGGHRAIAPPPIP